MRLILNKNNLNNHPNIRKFYNRWGKNPKNITELGYSDINQMIALLKKSKVLVDFHTGMLYHDNILICASPPLLILEAMSHNLGILSNDLPEIREIITKNKTGILLEKENPDEIYSALKKLLQNKKMSNAARKDTIERFDIKKLMPEYEKLYLEEVNKNDNKKNNL